MGCGTTRSVSRVQDASLIVRSYESADTVWVQVLVEVYDTIREVTTVTIATNDAGDTLKVVQVTERERTANRDRIHDVKEKVVERTDTVFVAVRDSTDQWRGEVTEARSRASPVVSALKWIFWIIVALTVLVATIKITRILF